MWQQRPTKQQQQKPQQHKEENNNRRNEVPRRLKANTNIPKCGKNARQEEKEMTTMKDSIEDSDHNIVDKALIGDGDDKRRTRPEAR